MKNKLTAKIGAVLICVTLIISISLSVVSFSDSSDPLVTLSYLTEIILPQFRRDVSAEIALQLDALNLENSGDASAEQAPLPEVSGEENVGTDLDDTLQTSSTGTYTLLELEKGTKVFTNSVLEFIVRPGSEVAVISPFEIQGVADITNGTEYLNGNIVVNNAYCIIPRGSDGRGIEVINEKSYILVRGEYYIG